MKKTTIFQQVTPMTTCADAAARREWAIYNSSESSWGVRTGLVVNYVTHTNCSVHVAHRNMHMANCHNFLEI